MNDIPKLTPKARLGLFIMAVLMAGAGAGIGIICLSAWLTFIGLLALLQMLLGVFL